MEFEQIVNDVYLLKIPFSGIWVGVYLVRGEQNVLIDSGLDGDGVDRYIVPALGALGMSVNDVSYCLNTHTHGDHIGGHARLKELNRNLKVICPQAGAEKVQDPLRYNIAIRRVFPDDSAEPSWHLKGVSCDGILRDGEKICGLRMIETPGHDSDCCCYFHEESKTLLTGDSLQQNGTDTQGMALYMYLDDYRASIGKLKLLGAERIVCGHPFNPLGAFAAGKRECEEYLGFCLSLTDEYERLISAFYARYGNMRDCATALIRAQNGVVPKRLYLALFTVSEHLKKIQKKERI